MRLALISPQWNEMINSYPPLGIGYLAAVAEQERHAVAVFDLGLDPRGDLVQDVERVVAYAPDCIGITAMTNNYHSVEQTAALLKERIGCPIIVGGPHATIFPERVVADPHVDYVIYGEGERTLVELLDALSQGGPFPPEETLRAIDGLCFSAQGGTVCNPPRELITDLDGLPFPARHLFELERYPLYTPAGEPMVTVLSSRGCPYQCSYCFKGVMGMTYRQRSPENVLAEIHQLVADYHYRNIYFIDDLFTFDRRRLRSIATKIIEDGLEIRWQCLARVDTVTPDLLKLMHRSGCREVHYGIESGVPEILKTLGKRIDLDSVRKAVSWTAEAGILAKGYFMLGLPGDTEETMRRTIAFASELELDQAMFSITTPFPGTRLWDELVARHQAANAACPAGDMHPIEFDQDFTRAFYYTNFMGADGARPTIAPFSNLSQVSDETLSRLAQQAPATFQEAKRRRKYFRALGPTLGGLAYRVSTIGALRRLGHQLLGNTLVRRIRGLGGIGRWDAREEYAQRWN